MRKVIAIALLSACGACSSNNSGGQQTANTSNNKPNPAGNNSTSSGIPTGNSSQDAGGIRPFWDDSNCGATGYACLNGRTCDLDTNTCQPAWQTISTTDSPGGVYGASAGSLNNEFVMTGGCTEIAEVPPLATTYIYNPLTDSWSTGNNLVTARTQHITVSTNEELYVLNGLTECQNGAALGAGTEVLYYTDQTWTTVYATGLYGAYNVGATWTGNSIFTFGGGNASTPDVNAAAILSLGTNWTDVSCPLLGCNRGGNFATFLDGPFVRVIGGEAFGDSTAPDGLLYDIQSNVWSSWTSPSGGPDFGSLPGNPFEYADDGSRLYVFDGSGNVYIYSRANVAWTTDSSTVPSGLCEDGATAWVNGEMIVYGGYCDGISSVGARYQPPAP